MRSLLPLAVCCISLVSLQRLQVLALQDGPDKNRLDLPDTDQEEASENQSNIGAPSSGPSRFPKWLLSFLGHQPASRVKTVFPRLAWARPREASQITGKGSRVRRQAQSGSRGVHHYPHHGQLMRVGCVLGTCQVQNLSHRLYQLIGQSGREDSAPINPRSPHSYG
ncbi:protein ADM2a [Mastacembelus armatus]|uniref:protein ADM2a n=1 Tax=Mastacembelus armatus TaxID=205130 RepID=UPI000E458578|nr:protein ADM2-like [Mastacembelus armatus]